MPSIQRRIVDRLVAEGALTSEAHALVLAHVGEHGGRMEDVIIDQGILSEADLLKAISTIYETRFISTQKLYMSQIDARIVALVPAKLATLHEAYPILLDPQASVLTVATPNPDNVVAFQEIRLAAAVREVRPIVARPAAVQAAIARSYHNDPQLFGTLVRPAVLPGAAAASTLPVTRGFDPSTQAAPPAGTNVPAYPVPATDVQLPPVAVEEAPRSKRPPTVPLQRARLSSVPPPPSQPGAVQAQIGPRSTTSRDYLETVNVLVSLLENGRPDLRGHSASVARIAQKICDRMGLLPEHTRAVRLAAYIHDLGKAGTYHLTALNVAEYDGHRTAAEKVLKIPEEILSSVDLAPRRRAPRLLRCTNDSTAVAFRRVSAEKTSPSVLGFSPLPTPTRISHRIPGTLPDVCSHRTKRVRRSQRTRAKRSIRQSSTSSSTS